MERLLVMALITVAAFPARAQEGDAWRDAQVALAAKSAAERAKQWSATERDLKSLEQREQVVLLETGIASDADPQGLHYRFIQEQGRARRPLLVADSASRARLDSVRAVGDASQIRQALRVRLIEAEALAVKADTTVLFWREVQRDVRRAEDFYRAEDKPSNRADVKQYVKRAITHFERFGRLCREAIDFETKLSQALRREAAEIERQLGSSGGP